MKLSLRLQYGLRMLAQLALVHEAGPCQLSELGKREGISEKYLGQIMLSLRSSGLVDATRGSQGGYFLSRPPELISVFDVMQSIDGAILDFDEEGSDSAGSQDTKAAANLAWRRLRAGMEQSLKETTLAELRGVYLSEKGFGEYLI